jgi:low affinity Fe/Cu permease
MDQPIRSGKKQSKIHKKFQSIADFFNNIAGSPYWFVFSIIIVLTWFVSGFFIGFTDTWQLIINTSTTIMTFLMISLLHSSQKKWEDKIERMQDREASHIREIKKETKRITMESPPRHEQEPPVNEPQIY